MSVGSRGGARGKIGGGHVKDRGNPGYPLGHSTKLTEPSVYPRGLGKGDRRAFHTQRGKKCWPKKKKKKRQKKNNKQTDQKAETKCGRRAPKPKRHTLILPVCTLSQGLPS